MAADGDHVVLELPPGDDDFVPVGQQPHVGDGNVFVPPQQFQAPPQQFQAPPQYMWPPPPWAQWMPHPQPPQLPVAQPHKVKLTDFWTHQPAIWFTHAEAIFATYNITEEAMRFNLVLPTLAQDTLPRVAAIVTAPYVLAAPYSALKARLLEVYQPDVWEQSTKILHYREMGDLKPSQMMDEMLALLPAEEVPGLLFKTIFLNRLPSDIRAHVQGEARQQECRQLAAAADIIWQARNQQKTAMLAAVPVAQVEELTEAVAAVKIQQPNNSRGGGRGRGRVRGKGRSGQTPRTTNPPTNQRTPYLCFKHARFGDAAWDCEDPGRCSATSTSGN